MSKARVAIIGAGISGLSTGHFLKNRYDVTLYEKESLPGGLIRCDNTRGLFHLCGGHVFNSKRQDVLDWFWSHFDRDKEFVKAERNSVVFLNDQQHIPYPIENHMYLADEETQRRFINDLISISKEEDYQPQNFEDFLRHRFGETLYQLYFNPYNKKVWRRPLNTVPLSWLEGKLPMPTVEEMIFNNMNHVEEKQFVHSTFWYAKQQGSQFIASRLAKGLNIKFCKNIDLIRYNGEQWEVEGEKYDKLVFCGNIKEMVRIISGVDMEFFSKDVEKLEFHGTTSVFCEIDHNPYSWIYMPSSAHESHRIICTGNFSPNNNPGNTMTGTIEFTDELSKVEIEDNLKRIPLHPKYIKHQFNPYTYPIQDKNTKQLISQIKSYLKPYHFYFTSRFADWEYYNMDVAIGAAMDLCKTI